MATLLGLKFYHGEAKRREEKRVGEETDELF